MTDKQLKTDIRVRGSIKQKITGLETYIESIKDADLKQLPTVTEIELKLTNFIPVYQEFQDVQLKIEVSCDESILDAQYQERDLFESRYCSAITFLKEFINQHSSESVLRSNNSNDAIQNVLLPKIKLPVFNGQYDQWLNFKNHFTATIHGNKSLNSSQKFQFLQAALEGYARRVIEGVDDSENQYERGWQLLCDRFDNKKHLINTHLKSIFNIQQLHKESYSQFRQMLDEISRHMSSIEGMKVSKDILWDNAIIHILAAKLDKGTLREWNTFNCRSDLPTLNEFLEFMKKRADVLEALEEPYSRQVHNKSQPIGSNSNFNRNPPRIPNPRSSFNFTSSNNNVKCNYCKHQHTIYKCQEFLKLSVAERLNKVRGLQLCNNCLRTGHSHDTCHLRSCTKCSQKHNTLLHQNNTASASMTNTHSSSLNHSQSSTNLLVRPSESNTQVLLSTVVFQVTDKEGYLRACRALLDSGAQSNLITESFCKKLKLPLTNTNLSIIGIDQRVSNITKKCNVNITSNFNNFQATLSCYVVPVISSEIPSYQLNSDSWNLPDYIKLSDPDFGTPRDIDILIGASLFWDLLLQGKIRLGKDLPLLQNTKFGWIVSGTIPIQSNFSRCNFVKVQSSEDEQLKRFWELEEVSYSVPLSDDDLQCEKLFLKDTFRTEGGQFVVKYPLKRSPELLGDSKDIAIKRFLSLEKKFDYNPQFKDLYHTFMKEYEELGHMSKIYDINHDSISPSYYLPHHGVLKEGSLSTKLRAVFDGSCPTNTGWSLNDLQFMGPKVQNNIFEILLRFRQYTYVVSADVSKMYRQVLMNPEHRPLQQIIWRNNPQDPFTTYQLNTITYGTTAAPYLAIKCMKQLALENLDKFPVASQTILNDFYVDDLLTGSNDCGELTSTCNQISAILRSGHFTLRKWISNNSNILSGLDYDKDDLSILTIGQNEGCKTLGIQWCNKTDIIKFQIKSFQINDSINKRQILSIIAQIYDPLGLLSPCIIISKIIIQELWSLQLSWDEPMPGDVKDKWTRFHTNLRELNNLAIPRSSVGPNSSLCDLHCFCDASQDAYAAAVYVRSVTEQGEYHVRLLCSKTKVAPLKTLTIPRLELCAAQLGALLLNQVVRALSLSVQVYLWSDSQVALCWIKTEPSMLQVFVANRVSKIQSLTSTADWNYVNTNENPADMASRGISPANLSKSNLWWNGPQFLKLPKDNWPVIEFNIVKQDLPELKNKTNNVLKLKPIGQFELFSKFSKLHKLVRVTAYCLRFIFNIKSLKVDKRVNYLSISEIESATLTLVKIAQTESFADELKIFKANGRLDAKHKFSSLSPFLDETGIIRVGGRLKFTSLEPNIKHPILLSSKHIFTKLIFQNKHVCLLHAGPQLLLASVRQVYWPIGGRNLARTIVKECLTCFKFNPSPASCPMSSLPDNRISPALPFQTVGVDYAGPIPLQGQKRSRY